MWRAGTRTLQALDSRNRTNLLGVATTIVQIGIGLVLIWASLDKLQYPYQFLSSVYKYGLVSAGLGLLVAAILPWLELLLGVFLVCRVWSEGAAVLAALILPAFVIVQAAVLYKGQPVPCACFDQAAETPISRVTVLRTGMLGMLCLMSLAGAVLGSRHSRRVPDAGEEEWGAH